MAAPIIPILKKLAVALVTDKKFRNRVFGIILGILVIIMLPVMAVVGVFSELGNINTSEMEQILSGYEATASAVATEIEEEMTAQGFTALKIEEAQTLYAFALYDYGSEEGFVEKLVGCYSLEEQTDEELITKVNETFGTEYTAEEYTSLMKEIRDTHVLDETKNQEGNIA
jgi:hypothetical protein